MESMNEVLMWFKTNMLPFTWVLVPIGILIGGWIVAAVVSGSIHWVLRKTLLNKRLLGVMSDDEDVSEVDAERWISRGVFYLLMLMVLVMFFESTGLRMVTQPLNAVLGQVLGYLPKLLSAVLLLALAWGLATILRTILLRVLQTARVDERLSESAGLIGEGRKTIPESVSEAAYWLVFLVFLPAVLGALGMRGILEPIQAMMADMIGFVPNVFAGILILLVGWFAARIVQRVVSNLLAATGIDDMALRAGAEGMIGEQTLSSLIGRIVHALILMITIVSALDALEFRAISAPATHMLTLILEGVPSLGLAAIILAVAYFIGQFLRGLVADLLSRMGFDRVLTRLGITYEVREDDRSPSAIAGHFVFIGVMLFALMESADALGFGEMADLVSQFTAFAGQIILGLIIFALGLFLANLAGNVVGSRGGRQARMLAGVTRGAVIVLSGAMALREMGIADDIINIAFGVMLGALALACAIAVGLGARDVAGREIDGWVSRLKEDTK